jgi:hypothetical protein
LSQTFGKLYFAKLIKITFLKVEIFILFYFLFRFQPSEIELLKNFNEFGPLGNHKQLDKKKLPPYFTTLEPAHQTGKN